MNYEVDGIRVKDRSAKLAGRDKTRRNKVGNKKLSSWYFNVIAKNAKEAQANSRRED